MKKDELQSTLASGPSQDIIKNMINADKSAGYLHPVGLVLKKNIFK